MHVTSQHEAAPPRRAPWYRQLYAQVLLAIVLGALLGHFQPALAEQFKPLGDGFIKLVKRVGAAVILLTGGADAIARLAGVGRRTVRSDRVARLQCGRPAFADAGTSGTI